ncbi:MAG: type II toxin-antitoxin system death-on-curing family toxin [Peptococcaceae bacterium]|nr:type II toxin-antitoxin system death-on-curing family toxin [Peptococcaceae bacterium]
MIPAINALYLHYRIIERTGGRHGVRDVRLLESALARPFATFDGQELYPDVYLRAAALAVGIIKNHPFVDGNKRTGIALAALFLEDEGLTLSASQKELVRFANAIAEGKVDINEVARWFKKHTG